MFIESLRLPRELVLFLGLLVSLQTEHNCELKMNGIKKKQGCTAPIRPHQQRLVLGHRGLLLGRALCGTVTL